MMVRQHLAALDAKFDLEIAYRAARDQHLPDSLAVFRVGVDVYFERRATYDLPTRVASQA
jgi:hypothetical protein